MLKSVSIRLAVLAIDIKKYFMIKRSLKNRCIRLKTKILLTFLHNLK